MQVIRRVNAMKRALSKYVSLGSLKYILTHPTCWVRLPSYVVDLLRYRRQEMLIGRTLPLRLYPILWERKGDQPVGSYFYQDTWAAKQVFTYKPPFVVDVGSSVVFVGIISQFVPVMSVDIRPVRAKLSGLFPIRADVLKLPFRDGSIPFITTLSVLEHIGLGRYGDPIDPHGTFKAVEEIKRVIRPGGVVVISVPVGCRDVLEFNAHRRFTVETLFRMFGGFELVDGCILTPEPVLLIQ